MVIRERLTQLFQELTHQYETSGLASLLEIKQTENVDAFYSFIHEPASVLHVRGFVEGSSEEQARLWVAKIDRDAYEKVHANGSARDEALMHVNHRFSLSCPYNPELVDRILAHYHVALQNGRNLKPIIIE